MRTEAIVNAFENDEGENARRNLAELLWERPEVRRGMQEGNGLRTMEHTLEKPGDMRYTVSEGQGGAQVQQAVGRASASTGFAKQYSANPAHGETPLGVEPWSEQSERRDAVARLGEQPGTRQQYAQMLAQRLLEEGEEADIGGGTIADHVGNDLRTEAVLPTQSPIVNTLMDGALGIYNLLFGESATNITEAEWTWIKDHVPETIQVIQAKNAAEKLIGNPVYAAYWEDWEDEENRYIQSGSRLDAMRHLFWSASIAYSAGADVAKEFTDAHETFTDKERKDKELELAEEGGVGNPVPLDGHTAMDLHNNELDISIGESIPRDAGEVRRQLLEYYDGDSAAMEEAMDAFGLSEPELLMLERINEAIDNGRHMQYL